MTTSHDARTPLSSIQVASQLLREKALSEDARDLLTAISTSSRVLMTLVNNVMLTKRLDGGAHLSVQGAWHVLLRCCGLTRSCCAFTGDNTFANAPLDICALVADVVQTSRVGLAQTSGTSIMWDEKALPPAVVVRGLRCRYRCVVQPPNPFTREWHSVPPPPQSCEEYLSHMLLNLVVYCVQASEGSAVHIRAACDPATKRGLTITHQLLLEVAIPGCQLNAAALANAFNPYAEDAEQWVRLHTHASWQHSLLTRRACTTQRPAGNSAPGRLGLHVSRRLAQGDLDTTWTQHGCPYD